MSDKKEQPQEPEEIEYSSFADEIWQRLSAVNVNEFTQDKGGLTYLSWSISWATLMEVFPESFFEKGEDEYLPDGTMSVTINVTVKRGDDQLTRSMYLQVLNHRNQAIENPNAHQINNARMRCLTKCIALFGLACYIYQSQDLPTEDDFKVVVKQPRIPHVKHFENSKKAMDEAPNLELLKIQSRGAYDYFEKWHEPEYCKAITKHFEKLEKTFEAGEKKDEK